MGTLAIRVGKLIAERHDAMGIFAVPEAKGITKLVPGFLQKALLQQRGACAAPQTADRDNCRAPATSILGLICSIRIG